jgi:hypothetical protein
MHASLASLASLAGLDPVAAIALPRVCRHPLGSVINFACFHIHSLLGDKIVYLPLFGFGFSALAGIGGGLVLDNVNRQRNRKHLGRWLLCCSIPLGVFCLLFGLP